MGGRGAGLGKGVSTFIKLNHNGRIIEVAEVTEKNMEKLGLDYWSFRGLKTVHRDFGEDNWTGGLNPISNINGKKISAKRAATLGKRQIPSEQRFVNDALKERILAKRNGTAYNFKKDYTYSGKRQRANIPKDARRQSLSYALQDIAWGRKDIARDSGFVSLTNKGRIPASVTNKINKLNRQEASIRREMKKYGIKID